VSPRRRVRALGLGLAAALVTLAAACGSDRPQAVIVQLRDYEITPRAIDAKPGKVTFDLTNTGTVHHAFTVVRTALKPEQLPVTADGRFDPKGAGVTVIDGKENVAAGQHTTLTVDLTAGTYVFVCNVDDHFKRKMYTRFNIVR
jgi:uncharacterized cupredoxin-like copper-binding protein